MCYTESRKREYRKETNMKICFVCKSEIQNDNTRFCPYCGSELTSPYQSSSYATPPTQGYNGFAGLKAQARDAIRGKIPRLFLIILIVTLISAALSSLLPSLEYTVDNVKYSLDVLSPIVTIFVSSAFGLSLAKVYLDVLNGYTPNISDAFYGFKNNYKTAVIMEAFRTLYVFLWSLLFIIPGIIKTLAYSMSSYVLYENPNLSAKEALRRSEDLMRGRKMEYFLLILSFIGWIILGIFTLGILYVWLFPYMQATTAAFYNSIRVKSPYGEN